MLHRALIGGEFRPDRAERLDLDSLSLEVGIRVSTTQQSLSDDVGGFLDVNRDAIDAADRHGGNFARLCVLAHGLPRER